MPEPLLRALASTMKDQREPDGRERRSRSRLHAGYTYLGQFIDHDLTHDPAVFGAAPRPGEPIGNLRTPAFDLDALYGAGPEHDPTFHPPEPARYGELALRDDLDLDLARDPATGRARIPEPRNDANLIVSQLHVAFSRAHNRRMSELRATAPSARARFAQARRDLCFHYQWIVLHDYLPLIVGEPLVRELLADDGAFRLVAPGALHDMPLEFSGAAFRFGHGMVRSSYQLNAGGGAVLMFEAADLAGPRRSDLRGFAPLQAGEVIDWDLFFPFGEGHCTPQLAFPIDERITPPLFNLPFAVTADDALAGRSLPYRNLMRGEHGYRLASGQEFAERGLGLAPAEILGGRAGLPMTFGRAQWGNRADVGGSGLGMREVAQAISERTPLWYYVLAEAAHFHGGEQLGPVGGRIVAEVMIALMRSDPSSFPGGEPGWRPRAGELGCRAGGAYAMPDLLRYAAGAA